MVSFSVHVTGLDELLATYGALPEKAEPIITRGLTKAAAEFVEALLEVINESFPPPSVPGEPPHVRTGALKRSVRIDEIRPFEVTVAAGGPGSLVPYATFLEFGTSKMEPRPFVGPTAQEFVDRVSEIVKDELDRGIEEAL